MYNKDNFQDMFGDEWDTKYLIETVLHCKKVFTDNQGVATREELIGLGSLWSNMACIDKLEELGYIQQVSDHEVSNYIKYRNCRL